MFFSAKEREDITKAIKEAELKTSGEIKVHVEEHCPVHDPIERAKEIFKYLYLDHTAYRNGVLFYLSITDRKFAILGDEGIYKATGVEFWEKEKEILLGYLREGNTVKGLIAGIEYVGGALSTFFPYDQKGDTNEISDDISFG